MKQLVTVFRAEAAMARRLEELCRVTPEKKLFSLRDVFRDKALTTSTLTGYAEFVDPWSMGDNFEDAFCNEAQCREIPSGEVYYVTVTDSFLSKLKAESKRSHQWSEQDRLVNCIGDLANTPLIPKTAMTLALFREILDVSPTDEEIQKDSNKKMDDTAL